MIRDRRASGGGSTVKKRHPNHRLVKIYHSYTVGEIATLFDIHKNTVRAMGQSWTSNLRSQAPDVDSRPGPYCIPAGASSKK